MGVNFIMKYQILVFQKLGKIRLQKETIENVKLEKVEHWLTTIKNHKNNIDANNIAQKMRAFKQQTSIC